jgi:hypothetical protein
LLSIAQFPESGKISCLITHKPDARDKHCGSGKQENIRRG